MGVTALDNETLDTNVKNLSLKQRPMFEAVASVRSQGASSVVKMPRTGPGPGRPVVSSVHRVQLGENQIFDQTRNQTFSSVKWIILHPSFDSAPHQSDIALVELESLILLKATISPCVCLMPLSVCRLGHPVE
ncbi:unnamed protein product [Caretta caretta]